MDISALDQCQALHQLTMEEREVIAALAQERSFAAGEQIIEDGSTGTALYILATGAVEVLKRGRPIARMGAGTILGEMSLFNQNVRTSEVRAVEPCTLYLIPMAAFISLVLRQEPAAVKMMETLGQLMVQRL